MPVELRTVNIFLASPKDAESERRDFPRIVQATNETKANPLGFHLCPFGWEKTLIGRGRPQGLINSDLGLCDVLVLVLWKRWGTPSGRFSSGVEEEYKLAVRLKKEIWAYFRDMPERLRAEPDDQARRVIAFQETVRRRRELLYSAYRDPKDWRKKFQLHLSRYLDSLFAAQLGYDAMRYYTPDGGGVGGMALWQGKHQQNLTFLLQTKRRVDAVQHGGARHSLSYFLLLYHLAVLYDHLGRQEEAESHLREGLRTLRLAKPAHQHQWEYNVFIRMYRIYRDLGKLRQARTWLSRAEKISEEHEDVVLPPLEAVPLCMREGDFQEAEKGIKRHLSVCEGDEERAKGLCQLAVLRRKQCSHEEARKLFEESLSMYERCGGSAIGTLRCAVHYLVLCRSVGEVERRQQLSDRVRQLASETGVERIDGFRLDGI